MKIPYAGKEHSKHEKRSKPDLDRILEQMILNELIILHKKINKKKRELLKLQTKLNQLRNNRELA